LFAQTPKAIAPTVGPAANSATALKQQNVPPNLAVSNATPALGKQGFTPAMPTPGTPALGQGFTAGIGGQGSGTAIGQQGSGTAIGQQGSGTAIGQQGFGTAIIPGTNAIVIGQPEPFTATPANRPPAGFTSNIQNRLGQRTPLPAIGFTNSTPKIVSPVPMNRAPTGKR